MTYRGTASFGGYWRAEITDAQAGRIVQAYKDDRPIDEIRSRFQISKHVLYKLLDARGVPLRYHGRGPKPSDTTERDRNIVSAYMSEEFRVEEIAAMVGASLETIYGVLRENGVPLRRARKTA